MLASEIIHQLAEAIGSHGSDFDLDEIEIGDYRIYCYKEDKNGHNQPINL